MLIFNKFMKENQALIDWFVRTNGNSGVTCSLHIVFLIFKMEKLFLSLFDDL